MNDEMTPLTMLHVIISLIGIGSGFVVLWGLLTSKRLDGWTATFLISTVLTSVTGFLFFPLEPFKPSHALGIISLVTLTVAIVARYGKHLMGIWRPVYVITVIASFYFNFFALVFQSFLKVPALHDAAPTQSEPPFLIAEAVVLILFIAAGVLATRRFRGTAVTA